MVLTYHRSNVGQIPNEDQFRQAVRALDIPQGEYMFPWGDGPEALKSEAYLKKLNEGPVGLLTIMPNGPWPMAKSLTQWFVYLVLVNIFVAYVADLALTDTSDAMAIFRLTTTVAFSGYGLALIQN
ncbi:MAG: hypothetical protein D6694_04440 [Gammaproteobacteria bacterium]|nr:MAG: hypothetical protein D6694_04440 [Gammaproteobacteria bacterium]